MRSLAFFAVGALLFVLASLGRFQSAALFPLIFGSILALAGALSLTFRRRSMTRTQIAMTVAGCVLAALAPAGQSIRVRVTDASRQRAAMARFETAGTPPLLFAHVLNNQKQIWRTDSSFDGITLVNFWATWCSPCLKEMPLLEAFSRSHDPAIVRVVGFTKFYEGKDDTTRGDELGRIEKVLQRAGVSYPTLVGIGATTHESYGVLALPTSVLIDNSGKVIAYGIGERGTKRLLKMADELAVTSDRGRAARSG